MEFRFNGRDNPFLFRDTLLILLHGDALPYKLLIERRDPLVVHHTEHMRVGSIARVDRH